MTTQLIARSSTALGRLAMAASAVAILAALSMTPALADDGGRHGGYERGWHGHDGRGHEWREHEWRRDDWRPRYHPYAYRYYDPYAYYAAPY